MVNGPFIWALISVVRWVRRFAPADGVLWCAGCNAKAGDYGPTIITMHRFNGQPLWMLYGHLSQASLEQWNGGESIEAGQRLGGLALKPKMADGHRICTFSCHGSNRWAIYRVWSTDRNMPKR